MNEHNSNKLLGRHLTPEQQPAVCKLIAFYISGSDWSLKSSAGRFNSGKGNHKYISWYRLRIGIDNNLEIL